jgi:hypothetical protein
VIDMNYSRKLARPPDGGRCARGQAAQRDDDPPRAQASWRSNRRSLPRARRTMERIADPGYVSPPDVAKHVDIISKEIRRLDDVLNRF